MFPQVWANPAYNDKHGKYIPNLIIVGATLQSTYKWSGSNYADWLTTFAPGARVQLPWYDRTDPKDGDYPYFDGTSYGK